VAGLIMSAMALVNMRGWLAGNLLPPHDFAGYVSVVEDVRDTVLRFGYVPTWSSKWFAGSTQFTSTFKELAAFPLAVCLGPFRAVQVMVFLTKVLAALAMYALLVRLFRSPPAGIVAGYAYAFNTPSNYHTSVQLDASFSYVLFPLIFGVGVELLRRRRAVWAVALGILVACQFSNNHVIAAVCPAIVILLAAFRPWRCLPSKDNPLQKAQLGRSWCALLGAALGVFLLFGSSQLAWLAADSSNHALHTPEQVAWGVETFIEHSPFVYLNRGNWLGPWLASHHPPGMLLFPDEPLRNQRHYLGIIAMLLCAAGWLPARRQYSLRRWYQLLALLFLIQYWLSMGPRTLLWQIARTFHWPESVDRPLELALTAASIACLFCALAVQLRRPARTGDAPAPRIGLALGLALVFFFASHSLFDAVRTVFPPLRVMRAPGRFFELAPFAFYCLVGVGLVAIERALPSHKLRRLVGATAAVLVVVDFWPSSAAFYRGTSPAPVQEIRELVAKLPAEDGTLRIALFPWEDAVGESLVSVASEAGVGWSWLPWQAGKFWPAYFRGTMLWIAEEFEPEEREIYRPVSEALGQIGRLKYFLGHPGHNLGPPWVLRAENEEFSLWERPDVTPMAQGYRAYALFVGENDLAAVLSVYLASKRNLMNIWGGERLSQSPTSLIDGAAVVLCSEPASVGDDHSRALADRYAKKVLVTDALELARDLPGSPSDSLSLPLLPLLEVHYSRPAPGHIILETDAGDMPVVVFVSEAYHPWWRAHVDGQPASVLRAQMAFMAVRVGPGEHTVHMHLERPFAVAAADSLTALSWIGLAAAAPLYGIVRFRRSRSQ